MRQEGFCSHGANNVAIQPTKKDVKLCRPIEANPGGPVLGQKLHFLVFSFIPDTSQVRVELPAVQLSVRPAQLLLNKNEPQIVTGFS